MSLAETFQNFSTLLVLFFNTIWLFFSFIFILIIFEYLHSLISSLISKYKFNKIILLENNLNNDYILINLVNDIEEQIKKNTFNSMKRSFYKNEYKNLNNRLIDKKNNIYEKIIKNKEINDE
jgi:hypothetical protein